VNLRYRLAFWFIKRKMFRIARWISHRAFVDYIDNILKYNPVGFQRFVNSILGTKKIRNYHANIKITDRVKIKVGKLPVYDKDLPMPIIRKYKSKKRTN